MRYLSRDEIGLAIKWSWLVQPPVILVFGFAKASICLFMLRLIGRTARWRRYGLYGIMFAVIFGNAVAVLITFVQCSPVYALWTQGMEGRCWNPLVQEHYNFALGGKRHSHSTISRFTNARLSCQHNYRCGFGRASHDVYPQAEAQSRYQDCALHFARSWSVVCLHAPLHCTK